MAFYKLYKRNTGYWRWMLMFREYMCPEKVAEEKRRHEEAIHKLMRSFEIMNNVLNKIGGGPFDPYY